MGYDLELDKVVSEVKKIQAKKICLQLPDGLKPFANEIVDELEKKFNSEGLSVQIWIWAGSAFGACDIPPLRDFDLLINFGHLKFKKPKKVNTQRK